VLAPQHRAQRGGQAGRAPVDLVDLGQVADVDHVSCARAGALGGTLPAPLYTAFVSRLRGGNRWPRSRSRQRTSTTTSRRTESWSSTGGPPGAAPAARSARSTRRRRRTPSGATSPSARSTPRPSPSWRG